VTKVDRSCARAKGLWARSCRPSAAAFVDRSCAREGTLAFICSADSFFASVVCRQARRGGLTVFSKTAII
jgi:hypothetical protein